MLLRYLNSWVSWYLLRIMITESDYDKPNIASVKWVGKDSFKFDLNVFLIEVLVE